MIFIGSRSSTSLVIRDTTVLRSFDSMVSVAATTDLEDSGVALKKKSEVAKVEKNAEGKLTVHLKVGLGAPVGSRMHTKIKRHG